MLEFLSAEWFARFAAVLAEVEELARTAGVEPVGRVVQHRARPAQRTYVGKGKLEELKERFAAADAEVLLVDDELDPVQQRFLEDRKLQVIDDGLAGLFGVNQVGLPQDRKVR